MGCRDFSSVETDTPLGLANRAGVRQGSLKTGMGGAQRCQLGSCNALLSHKEGTDVLVSVVHMGFASLEQE